MGRLVANCSWRWQSSCQLHKTATGNLSLYSPGGETPAKTGQKQASRRQFACGRSLTRDGSGHVPHTERASVSPWVARACHRDPRTLPCASCQAARWRGGGTGRTDLPVNVAVVTDAKVCLPGGGVHDCPGECGGGGGGGERSSLSK